MAIGDTVQAGLMRFDSSAYERAGQANAQANAAFGNALNQVARGFIEGQEKKARAEEMTGYLMNQGVSESDAKAIAKNPFLQKEYQRKKATEAQMQMEGNRLAMQGKAIAQQAKSASETNMLRGKEFGLKEEIHERGMADRETLAKFSGDLLSETTDPEVVRQVEEARPGMSALGDEGQRNRFLDYQQEQQPKVAVGELGSADFAEVARERELDPTLAGGRFMNLQKTEQETLEKNLGTLGDQFASTVGPVDHHFFSEADAVNAINERANKMGIALNKEQMESALSSQRIVDLKELRAESSRQIKTSKLTEAVSILEAGKALNEFLDDGGPLSINVAKEKLARMVQPDGILTESDLSRVGGSKGLVDRINAAIKEISDGTADEKTKEYLRATAGIFSKSASDKINFEGPRISTYLSRTFRIGVDDVWDYTTVGDFYDYVEAPVTNGTGASPAGSSPQPPGGASSLPGGGVFTPSNQ